MGDWVKVEFLGQLPDGMQVIEVDAARTSEEIARLFGFSRVDHLSIEQVNDGTAPEVRKLLNDLPSEGTRFFPTS